MIASSANPYQFTAGGTIRGDYKFKNASVVVSGGGSIKLANDTKLQQEDGQVSISFDDKTNIDGDVLINGTISAGNLSATSAYPVNAAFQTVTTPKIVGQASALGVTTEFSHGLVVTDMANGVRSNNYKSENGTSMMSTDATKINVWQATNFKSGNVTVDAVLSAGTITSASTTNTFLKDVVVAGGLDAGPITSAGLSNIHELSTTKLITSKLESSAPLEIQATSVRFETTTGDRIDVSNIDLGSMLTLEAVDGEIDNVTSECVASQAYEIIDGGGAHNLFNSLGNQLTIDSYYDTLQVDSVSTQKVKGTGTFSFEGYDEINFADMQVSGTSHFPSGTGSGGFIVEDNAYQVDKPIDFQDLASIEDGIGDFAELVAGTGTFGTVETNVLAPNPAAAGTEEEKKTLTFDYGTIDFGTATLNGNFGNTAVGDDLTLKTLVVQDEFYAPNKIVMPDGDGANIDVLSTEMGDSWLSVQTDHLNVADTRIVFETTEDSNGDTVALSELYYNNAYTGIYSPSNIFLPELTGSSITLRLNNDFQHTGTTMHTREDDDDVYPFQGFQPNSTGTRFLQERFSIMPRKSSFALPSPFNPFAGPFNHSGVTSKNSGLEVFALCNYWKSQSSQTVDSFQWPVFQTAADPTLVAGYHQGIDAPPWDLDTGSFNERPSCVSINKPPRFSQYMHTNRIPDDTKCGPPDALTIRFGYNDQFTRLGAEMDQNWYDPSAAYDPRNELNGDPQNHLGMYSGQRGISFRVPIWSGARAVEAIQEVVHIGRDYSTFGCAMYDSFGQNSELYADTITTPIMTIAPHDWILRFTNNTGNDQDYLDQDQLCVVGGILRYNSNKHKFNNLNYTLSHHCETDEAHDWNNMRGRLVSYTGVPAGNDNGAQILDWKHGLHNHALTTVALTTDQEDVNFAGIVQGLTADIGDDKLKIHGAITNFQKYHGVRQTVEVADRGDAMVWVVVPLSAEIPADPHMLSGLYFKQVNGMSVADEVIIHVNDDYSFTITEHTSSIIDAIAALQSSVNNLLNMSHSHP